MSDRVDPLWTAAAERILAHSGLRLQPAAILGDVREDRRTWLADSIGTQVVVKVLANPFAHEKTAGTVAAFSVLGKRGYPVPDVLWHGYLDTGWYAVVLSWLPGEPVTVLDGQMLAQLMQLIELQAGPISLTRGWDVSEWIGNVLFDGWAHWWDSAMDESPEITRRVHALLEPVWRHRLSADDVVHHDLNLSNVLVHNATICGVVDWDHSGRGSRAVDLTTLLFEWHRLRRAGHDALATDGGARLVDGIIEIAGQEGLRCTVAYAAIARLALCARRRQADQLDMWRSVISDIVDEWT